MWSSKNPKIALFEKFHIRCNFCTYRIFYRVLCMPLQDFVTMPVTFDEFESHVDRCNFMECAIECIPIVKNLEYLAKNNEINDSLRLDYLMIAKWLRSMPYTLQDIKVENPFAYEVCMAVKQ